MIGICEDEIPRCSGIQAICQLALRDPWLNDVWDSKIRGSRRRKWKDSCGPTSNANVIDYKIPSRLSSKYKMYISKGENLHKKKVSTEKFLWWYISKGFVWNFARTVLGSQIFFALSTCPELKVQILHFLRVATLNSWWRYFFLHPWWADQSLDGGYKMTS